MKNFTKFIIFLVITVLLAAGGTVIYYYQKDVKEVSDTVFYVSEIDGTEITETYEFMLSPYVGSEFIVKGDINLNILPNYSDEGNNFEFTHDGRRKQFFAERDLAAAFNIERNGNVLNISLKEDCRNLINVLEKIYDGETIVMPEGLKSTNDLMFMLVIKQNGSILSRTIYFGINKEITGVSLSPEKIIF